MKALALMLTTVLATLVALPAARAADEPAFTQELSDGAIDVRAYGPLVIAEVTVSGDRRAAANAGFRPLADYIFGKNRPGPKIAMTAPVLQERVGETIAMTAPVLQEKADSAADGTQWIVRFIMPAGSTLETLPQPVDPNVRLMAVPAQRLAVIRFSGIASEKALAEKTAELDRFLAARGLTSTGEALYAFYNPPWTLPFLRRNEVMRRLAPSEPLSDSPQSSP